MYSIAQKFDRGNFDEFDERPAIRQSFPFQLFPVNAFPMKPTINSSKFCSSKFRARTICQSFPPSNFCTIRYIVLSHWQQWISLKKPNGKIPNILKYASFVIEVRVVLNCMYVATTNIAAYTTCSYTCAFQYKEALTY